MFLLLSELFFRENSFQKLLEALKSSRQFCQRWDIFIGDIDILTRASESNYLSLKPNTPDRVLPTTATISVQLEP